MDNLNTNQITLGNMGQVEVEEQNPDESTYTNVDIEQQKPDESKKPYGEETQTDNGQSNMLIFGGLLALLFLFRKKL